MLYSGEEWLCITIPDMIMIHSHLADVLKLKSSDFVFTGMRILLVRDNLFCLLP